MSSRLIFDKLTLYSNANYSSGAKEITGIHIDAREFNPEPNKSTIDAGREITESYTVNFKIKTRNKTFTGGGLILADTFVSTNGTVPTTCYPKFSGASGSLDVEFGAMLLSGYEDFSDGFSNIVLEGSVEVVQASDAVTSS